METHGGSKRVGRRALQARARVVVEVYAAALEIVAEGEGDAGRLGGERSGRGGVALGADERVVQAAVGVESLDVALQGDVRAVRGVHPRGVGVDVAAQLGDVHDGTHGVADLVEVVHHGDAGDRAGGARGADVLAATHRRGRQAGEIVGGVQALQAEHAGASVIREDVHPTAPECDQRATRRRPPRRPHRTEWGVRRDARWTRNDVRKDEFGEFRAARRECLSWIARGAHTTS